MPRKQLNSLKCLTTRQTIGLRKMIVKALLWKQYETTRDKTSSSVIPVLTAMSNKHSFYLQFRQVLSRTEPQGGLITIVIFTLGSDCRHLNQQHTPLVESESVFFTLTSSRLKVVSEDDVADCGSSFVRDCLQR